MDVDDDDDGGGIGVGGGKQRINFIIFFLFEWCYILYKQQFFVAHL